MTPLEMAVVRRKLRRIRGNIATLTTATEGVDPAAYVGDELLKRAIERLLQETVDAAVDINNHLLKSVGQPPAEDYFGSFVQLGRCRIIDMDLAASLAPAAGLRNRIVHEYEELNDAVVLEAAKLARGQFSTYIAAIEKYLGASDR